MNKYITVIGGANIDITGTPYSEIVMEDSNPGSSQLSLGGVGRNIAENLSRLNISTKLITALGQDHYSKIIRDNSKENNIDLSHSLTIENGHTSTYICINDSHGEMKLAISHMNIYENLIPLYLEEKLGIINSSEACVVDTNIPVETIAYIMDKVSVPIFLDTVSTKKTEKIKDVIHNIHSIKPNLLEAEILSGIKIIDEVSLNKAIDIIHSKGVKRIFLSLGRRGVFFSDGHIKGQMNSVAKEIVNTTGAGDSFLAGVLLGYLNGLDIENTTRLGLASSSITLASHETVSKNMSLGNVSRLFKEIGGNYEQIFSNF